MLEKAPPAQPVPDTPTWDIAAIAEALHTQPSPLSEGDADSQFSFHVGDRSDLHPSKYVLFELTPSSAKVRIVSAYLVAELSDLPPPITTQDQVVFERQDTARLLHLSLTSRGELTLLNVPLAQETASNHDPNSLQLDDATYADQLATQSPPFGMDDYGPDEIKQRRLLDMDML